MGRGGKESKGNGMRNGKVRKRKNGKKGIETEEERVRENEKGRR